MVTESFVPVAENVSELQSSEDEKGKFFRDVAVQGRMKGRSRPGVSHQGIYALTPGGKTLASGNPLEANATLTLLRDALQQWQRQEPRVDESLQFAPESDDHGYPEDGLVLRMTARDLPRGNGSSMPNGQARYAGSWNHDFVWLTRKDVRSLLPVPMTVGATRDVPQPLLRRLARFHLRDIVRGEPWVWGPKAVKHVRLCAEVVKRDGDHLTLRYAGDVVLGEHVEFRDSHQPIDWAFDNVLDAAITGEAIWNDETETFELFDLLVAGQRSGAHRYNGRTSDPGPGPIGFSFELAADSPWERTPPHVMRTRTRAGQPMPAGPTTVSDEAYYEEP